MKYWQPETLATETEAPATKSTSVAGSSIANNYVTVLFVVSLFILPLIFNIVNYTLNLIFISLYCRLSIETFTHVGAVLPCLDIGSSFFFYVAAATPF